MEFTAFDIIGPVMIGPSSSHTAGAVRLGRISRMLLGGEPVEAQIFLHGSFAQTYRGHGTDLAITAGIMGMDQADPRIPDARQIAKARGLKITFQMAKLGDVHPNTAKIVLKNDNQETITIIGSSIGGGQVVITRINAFDVELSGSFNAIITQHYDRPGIVARATQVLADNHINIAQMRVSRTSRGADALMIIETDQRISAIAVNEIEKIDGVQKVKFLEPN